MSEKLECTDCTEMKLPSEFFNSKAKRKRNRCISCHYTGPNSKVLFLKSLLAHARRRASKKGLEYSITLNDLIQLAPECCPVNNNKLVYIHKKFNPDFYNTASIDRIDSQKGYIKENIRIISLQANILKNSCKFEDLIQLQNYFIHSSPPDIQNIYKQLLISNLNFVINVF